MAFAYLILPIILMILLIWLSSKIHTIAIVFSVLYCGYLLNRATLIIMTTEFALTNMRVVAKKGLIMRNTVEIRLNQLESISISQRIDGRILGFGTVTVVGTGGTREKFKSISDPFELQKQVNNQVSVVHPKTWTGRIINTMNKTGVQRCENGEPLHPNSKPKL
ncbi:MAG TPA: PH domain-containing protein [Anaerolineae bacterium]|nr:PH domain-containing protein [Anaerolineae bacterium]